MEQNNIVYAVLVPVADQDNTYRVDSRHGDQAAATARMLELRGGAFIEPLHGNQGFPKSYKVIT